MRRRLFIALVAFVSLATFTTRAAAQNPFATTDGVLDSNVGAAILDPHGNVKELGPLNGASTKIGVINTAVPPMLEVTNPNGQVDLGSVWISTRVATNTNQWLYFAWNRPDSNTGSGFISIEFQQNALSASCVYTGVDFTNKTDPETAALIANCNPWRNRKDGDFIITWDQQGNGLAFDDIKKRTFTCTGSAIPYTCTLGPVEDLGSVEASVSADRFFGEMAINLTTEVFGTTNSCLTFSNVLPGTVTGNSDTADYKDTIFATTPPITNCGVLKIRKVTQNADGVEFTDPNNPAFGYTVTKSGDSLRYDLDAANHPVDGAAPQTQIVRPNSNTPAGPSLLAGTANAHTHTDLIPGSNYTLVEATPPAPYALVSIVCTDATGTRTLHPGPGNVTTYSVSIPSGTFQYTECVITNRFVRASPAGTTAQSATVRLFDSISITGILAGASDASSATATFRLYSDNTCSTLVAGSTSVQSLTYGNGGTTATANTLGGTGVLVSAGATYYWRVTYTGDGFNNGFTTGCGVETTAVTITIVNDGAPGGS